MLLLDDRYAKVVEHSHVDGLTQTQIAARLTISQPTVSRTLDQFEQMLCVVLGPDYAKKWSPGYVRDVVVRMLGNAEKVRNAA